MLEHDSQVDLAALISALPQPALLVGPQLTVQAASIAFLQATASTATDVLQVPVAELPGCVAAEPRRGLAYHDIPSSIQRVFDTGRAEQLPAIAYYLTAIGSLAPLGPRWCSVSNVPICNSAGVVAFVLYLARDVTDLVSERRRGQRLRHREEQLTERAQRLQSEYQQRLAQLGQGSPSSASQLPDLAHLSLDVAAVETMAELTEIILGRGIAAFGAKGGGLAVRDHDLDFVHFTASRIGTPVYQRLALTQQLPAVVAAVLPDPIYLPDRAAAVSWGSEMAEASKRAECQAWAALPLTVGEEVVGSVLLSWDSRQEWTRQQREALGSFAAQCAQALIRIQAKAAEQQAIDSSRLLSEALQRSLLSEPPMSELGQLAARYRAASRHAEIGGDWYDAFELSESLYLVVGDVIGHDRAAAAKMSQLRGLLRGVTHACPDSPSGAVAGLDQAMADLGIDTMASAIIARISPGKTADSCILQWSNAGHPPPLLVLADGTTKLLETPPELLLGVQALTSRTDHSAELPEGSTLLLYSDGLIERRGESLDCGLAWLQRRAGTLHGLPLAAVCDALLAELPTDREDDVALLALRVPAVASRTSDLVQPSADCPTAAEEPAAGTPRVSHRGSLVLTPDMAAVRRARAFVRQHCLAAQVTTDTIDTVALLTSETVTNAFIHGRSEARIALHIMMGTIRIEIGDDNARHPLRAVRNNDALDGRGLDILELMSSDWGVFDEPSGKVVWFEVMDRPRGPEQPCAGLLDSD